MESSKKFNKKYFGKLSFGLIALLILFAGAVYLFVYILEEVLREKEVSSDNAVFNYLSANVINDKLTGFMKAVTYFASANFLQIAYLILIVFYLLLKHWKRAVEIVFIGLGGFLVNYFMKLAFHRLRPPHPLINPLNNFSFPSGHATSGFIFYGLLTYLIWKTNIPKMYKYLIGIILISFSLLIGFSRIYLRVHYPSDVLAGFCIGFAWLILTVWTFEWLKKRSDREMHKAV